MTYRSINQMAQDENDTTANEAARILAREAAIARAWRQIAYDEGESSCTAIKIADLTELPADYVILICGRKGLPLVA